MQQLHDLYSKVLNEGVTSEDRTGTGTIKLIGQQMRFDLKEGFPATTTKRLAWKAMTSELLWFLEGSQNERRLCEILHGTTDPAERTIWTGNFENQGQKLGYINGNLGPVYGKQWREWEDVVILPGVYTEVVKHTEMGYNLVERTTSGMYVMQRTIDQIAVLIDGLKNDPSGRRHILSAWNVGDLDKMALPPCHSFVQFFVVDGKLSCSLYQR